MPLVWQLARMREARKEAAENKRLLYVAATRARDRLLVSGHVKIKPSGELSAGGWLQAICDAAGVLHAPAGFQADGDCAGVLAPESPESWPDGEGVSGMIYGGGYTPVLQRHAPAVEEEVDQEGQEPCLLAPLAAEQADGDTLAERVWRVAPRAETRWAPAWVIGKLVHAAIAAWRWPSDERTLTPGAAPVRAAAAWSTTPGCRMPCAARAACSTSCAATRCTPRWRAPTNAIMNCRLLRLRPASRPARSTSCSAAATPGHL